MKAPVVVLFLPPSSVHEVVDGWVTKVHKVLKEHVKRPFRINVGEPPFVDEGPEEIPFYIKIKSQQSADAKRKQLGRQIFQGVVQIVAEVSKHQPQIIVGVGQGALLALLCTRPLLVEAACRARTLQATEPVPCIESLLPGRPWFRLSHYRL